MVHMHNTSSSYKAFIHILLTKPLPRLTDCSLVSLK